MHKVIQCGFVKSGNYLLYTALKNIYEHLGLFNSYIRNNVAVDTTRFSTIPEPIDNVRMSDGRLYLIVPHPDVIEIPLEIDDFLRETTIVWTHETPTDDYFEAFRNIDKWVYIYRDGRDVINSLMYYVVNEKTVAQMKDYKITDVEVIYKNYEYFAKHVKRWADNINHIFSTADRYHIVRFEQFVRDKRGTLMQLRDYLGLDFPVSVIEDAVSLRTMQSKAPDHVRKGKPGDWKTHFDARHRSIFKDIAGKILIDLDYERDLDW